MKINTKNLMGEILVSQVTIKKYLLFLLLFSLCSSEASQSEISEEKTNTDEAVELVQSPTTTSGFLHIIELKN
jgi:hypothetical protein